MKNWERIFPKNGCKPSNEYKIVPKNNDKTQFKKRPVFYDNPIKKASQTNMLKLNYKNQSKT